MNKEVNFKLAKFLKEKKFDRDTKYNYDLSGEKHNVGSQNHNLNIQKVSAPTMTEVVMWLYEKHGIWIYPILNIQTKKFLVNIDRIKPEFQWQLELFDSPNYALHAAIEYTLNNLI